MVSRGGEGHLPEENSAEFAIFVPRNETDRIDCVTGSGGEGEAADYLALIDLGGFAEGERFGGEGESDLQRHRLIGEVAQEEAAAELHLVEIAAGGVHRIVSPPRNHDDLLFDHLDLGAFSQHGSLPAAPEHPRVAEAVPCDEREKHQTP